MEFEIVEKVQIVSLQMIKEKEIDVKYSKQMNSNTIAAECIREYIGNRDREYMVVLCLDNQNKINCMSVVAIGSLSEARTTMREIFKLAILSNASSIILGHNHPAGTLKPSSADKNITEAAKEAGELLKVKLLDHIIVSDTSFYSFAQEGFI